MSEGIFSNSTGTIVGIDPATSNGTGILQFKLPACTVDVNPSPFIITDQVDHGRVIKMQPVLPTFFQPYVGPSNGYFPPPPWLTPAPPQVDFDRCSIGCGREAVFQQKGSPLRCCYGHTLSKDQTLEAHSRCVEAVVAFRRRGRMREGVWESLDEAVRKAFTSVGVQRLVRAWSRS